MTDHEHEDKAETGIEPGEPEEDIHEEEHGHEEEHDHEDDHEDDHEKEHGKTHSKHHPAAAAKKRTAVKKLQDKIKELEESLETAKEEVVEYKDKYLRNLAEIDNFRKRVKKEKEEYQKYVLSDFLIDLLQVYDNMERALKASAAEADAAAANDETSIISGVEMIHRQFSDLLKKNNVVEIEALNQPFDPNVHQALTKEESEEVSEPMVAEVYQKGFLYNGKLLKPTLAKVAIPLEEEKDASGPGEPGEENAGDE
jgi:molecular chaperone GrpE